MRQQGQDRIWRHYLNDIIAADVAAAEFLYAYLHLSVLQACYTRFLEVADLQRYTFIRRESKVRRAIARRASEPFVFVIGKN